MAGVAVIRVAMVEVAVVGGLMFGLVWLEYFRMGFLW